jgi:membrane protein required for colicin V production
MTPAVLDITIAVIILLSTLIAWYRGIIREAFTILGLLTSTAAAWKGGPMLVPSFNKWLGVDADGGEKAAEIVTKGSNAEVTSSAAMQAAAQKSHLILGIISPAWAAKIAAYGTAFFLVFLIMALLSFFISRAVQESGLGFLDKFLGILFGAARGFALVFLFYVPWTFLVPADKFPAWATNSVSVPILQSTLAWADQHFNLKEKIEDRGGAIAIKIGKVDPDKIGEDDDKKSTEEKELHDELSHEEETAQPSSAPATSVPVSPMPVAEPTAQPSPAPGQPQ